MANTLNREVRHGLSFVAVLSFVAGFFGARLFATLNPNVVIVNNGIHFHHFWYGIAMLAVAGWLGIAVRDDRFDRIYAVIYGLGAGFIGDEVGLLLTFGDYNSELTYEFFIGVVAFILAATLFFRYRKQVENEFIRRPIGDRLIAVGVFLAAFSTIFFAFEMLVDGSVLASLGALTAISGFVLRPRR